MPRVIKYDDGVFQKPNYWGRIFIYNNPSWNILYPIVDIIRILPKDTIIAHKYGKNTTTIRTYGSQYNHSVVGIDLNKQRDYIDNLKTVKFIFLFSDTHDTFADNIINYCEKSKTNLICYSTLDNIYHFYDYTESEKIIIQIKEPKNVIEKIEEIKERTKLNKLQDLFPEFQIIEPEEVKTSFVLERCLHILKDTQQKEDKKKVYSIKIPFIKIEESKKKVVYDDELPVNKVMSSKTLLSQFFGKKSSDKNSSVKK
jgi:hypothetical protein